MGKRTEQPDRSRFDGKDLLDGRRCVVTGGGAGIGRQIAYTLAEQGAAVAVLDYNEDLARAAARLIDAEFGERAFPVIGDVSDLAALEGAFGRIAERFGGSVDLFVNNAGISLPCRVEDLLLEGEEQTAIRQVMVNQVGAYFCAAHAYPLLLEGTEPIFIMIGSCASVGSEGQAVYSGTKAALRGLLGALVKEWAATDDRPAVRVGLIEPDYFERTPLRSQAYLEKLARARRTTVENIANEAVAQRRIPLRREGRLVEIAEKVVTMALDTYGNGNIALLSGGKTVRP
ncbi:MAG: SDR family NAD(P)-dependent oxidoreductase [Candidatus Brocadiia bacterium]